MRYLSGFLLLVFATVSAAQIAPSVDTNVRRVGQHLACQCGCKDTMASCSMPSCESSVASRARIARMQAEGASDQTIIDAFIKEYGPGIYRGSPSAFSWLIPYLSLGFGTLLVVWLLKRSRKPKPLPVMDPQLARYNEQIEKELANLD
jgi:cytochrome c-type biogenesis protein CcmH/NrfF